MVEPDEMTLAELITELGLTNLRTLILVKEAVASAALEGTYTVDIPQDPVKDPSDDD